MDVRGCLVCVWTAGDPEQQQQHVVFLWLALSLNPGADGALFCILNLSRATGQAVFLPRFSTIHSLEQQSVYGAAPDPSVVLMISGGFASTVASRVELVVLAKSPLQKDQPQTWDANFPSNADRNTNGQGASSSLSLRNYQLSEMQLHNKA